MSTIRTAESDADSLKNGSGLAKVVQTNIENQRVEISRISSGIADIEVNLEIQNREVHVYANFKFNPSGYYAPKLSTLENGV